MTVETCSNCCFFHNPSHSIKPMCRRYPPTLWLPHDPSDPLMSAFPNTPPKAWCGEWKRSHEDEAADQRALLGGPSAAARAFAHGRKRKLEVV